MDFKIKGVGVERVVDWASVSDGGLVGIAVVVNVASVVWEGVNCARAVMVL